MPSISQENNDGEREFENHNKIIIIFIIISLVREVTTKPAACNY